MLIDATTLGATILTSLEVGTDTYCAERDDDELYCWGRDPKAGANMTVPTLVDDTAVGGTKWTAYAVGAESICGVRDDGVMYCWGRDYWGNLGRGTAYSARPALLP